MTDVVDILNQGLRAGGVSLRISDIYEGSEAAKVALEIYGQARDELIVAKEWSFSRRTVALTKLKGPPPPGGYNPTQPWNTTYPNPPFLYSYGYPADCLDLRSIIQAPYLLPDLDPVPAVFRVDNDALPNVANGTASGPPAKVILCNLPNAVAVYRAQVTDPDEWDPGFTSALVASLGRKFAKAFGTDPTTNQQNTAEAVATAQTASEVRG